MQAGGIEKGGATEFFHHSATLIQMGYDIPRTNRSFPVFDKVAGITDIRII